MLCYAYTSHDKYPQTLALLMLEIHIFGYPSPISQKGTEIDLCSLWSDRPQIGAI